MIVLLLIVLISGLIVFYVITIYNRFQSLYNGAEATLSQIQVALKKRLDMLEQLIENIRSYARFEKETLENITKMRSALSSREIKDINKIGHESSKLLGNIMLTVEAYPDLKTSEVVKDLTKAIKNVESELARHRYTYNNIVQEINTKVDTFPSNAIAGMFNFSKLDYLEFGEKVENRPSMDWKL